jgi:hypothetical protein
MERHIQLVFRIGSASVEIDNVSDICAASIDQPIVPVKRGSVTDESVLPVI